MSLVDYASSDEDEKQDIKEESMDNTYIPIEEPSNVPNQESRPPTPLPRNQSNVVTEDISKLFVRRPTDPSSI